MGFHLAVDGGNSKTVAAVVDDSGAVVGRGRAGCCDIYSTATPAVGAAAVVDAVRAALADAGADELEGAAFRLASGDWPEDLEWWTDQLRTQLAVVNRLTPARLQVGNDALSTLRLGDLSGVGISVVVGTGPAIGARSSTGREAWSGVWIFDSLGGIGISDLAMRAVCRHWLGIAPATALTPALLDLFDEPDVWHLTHSFRRRFGARDRADLVRATRVVMQVAAAGDLVATEIVAGQGEGFADYAQAIAAQAGIATTDGVRVVLNGSIATSECGVVRDALVASLASRFPHSEVGVAAAPPIDGVILDALAAGGVALTPALREAICAAPHPDSFLNT
jgi:N-acetylglucosamine kinase-like BadF-type ATPase